MTTRQRLFYILIPGAAPAIIAGLRLGTALGVLGAVVAEMVASYSELGQRLVQTSNQFDIAGTFGVLLILGTIAGGTSTSAWRASSAVSEDRKKGRKKWGT